MTPAHLEIFHKALQESHEVFRFPDVPRDSLFEEILGKDYRSADERLRGKRADEITDQDCS